MESFAASFLMIFFAEMGDKTQLLALAFCARYKMAQVLAGVFLATLLLNAAAVGMGKFLCAVVPFKAVSLAASLSFIIFGALSLKKEAPGTEVKPRGTGLGPVAAVALAFFLAEFGDKTQLAAISLSVEYKSFTGVFSGAVLGMFAGDVAGIAAGGLLKKYIPQHLIRFLSALIFILLGLWGLKALLTARIPG